MATSSTFNTRIQYLFYNIEVIENSTSISGNTSSVTVNVRAWCTGTQRHTLASNSKVRCNINNVAYEQTVQSTTTISNSAILLFSATVTIPHNNDGSKSLYVEGAIYDAGFGDYISQPTYNGFTVTLTTIARQATITGAGNFNDEQNPVINYTNPAGNLVTSLKACIIAGGTTVASYRDITKTGTSYTFNLTTAERNALRAQAPNSNSLTVTFRVQTVSQGSTFTSDKTATMSIVNANPVLTGASYYDSNASIVAITTDNTKIVRNKSTLVLKFASITAQKSATLSSVAVTINGVTNTLALSGTSQSNKTITWGTLNVTSDTMASIVVTDSRGNTQMSFLTISVYNYFAPSNFCLAKRVSNFYDTTTITTNVKYAELGGHNSLTITWAYKLKSASTWTDQGTIANNTTTTITLDNTKAYEVKFTATDLLESSTITRNIPVGIPLMFFDTDQGYVGIQCMPKRYFCSGKPINVQSENDNVTMTIGSYFVQIFEDSSPSQKMRAQLNGYSYGSLQLFNSEQSLPVELRGDTGNVRCVSLTQTSSRKVKENIKALALSEAQKVLELEPVTFDFKDKAQGTDHRGFIAEDVAEVIPELVSPETENAPASLNYAEIIPYLLRVMQDQEERITALENKLRELEGS